MDVVPGRCRVACALFYLSCAAFIDGLREIPAQLGETVKLSCRAQDDMTGLFLTRSDLDPSFVFVFRDSRPDLTRQNKQFVDRVTLPGPLVANDDGDVILLLRNVSWGDNGTYTCAVHKAGADPAETSFDLRVVGPGGADPPTRDPTARDPTARDPTARDPPTRDPTARDPTARDPPTRDPTTRDPTARDIRNFIKLVLIYGSGVAVVCFVACMVVNH